MKGISPLIASVLLIAFTVSVSMIILGWFSGFAKSSTSNISSSAVEVVGCNSALVSIDHVYIGNSTSNFSSILVRNGGYTQLNVTGIVVNSSGGSCLNSTGMLLPKGTIGTLNFTNCTVFPNGITDWSRAIATTNCGSVSDSTADSSIVN